MFRFLYIRLLTSLAALLVVISATATSLLPADSAKTIDSAELTTSATTLSDSIISMASQYLGVPYRSGGKTPKGFDCSGFVRFIYSKFGYSTPASSRDIRTVGKEVKKDAARVGDIIYFTGRNAKSKRPGHVGIITEIKDGTIYFIHASVNLGISYSNNQTAYYKKRYLGIRRVL